MLSCKIHFYKMTLFYETLFFRLVIFGLVMKKKRVHGESFSICAISMLPTEIFYKLCTLNIDCSPMDNDHRAELLHLYNHKILIFSGNHFKTTDVTFCLEQTS